MASPRLQSILRTCAIVISTCWMALTIYQEFFNADPLAYGFKNPLVEQKLQSCTGTFEQRYRCKEDLIIEKGHEDFLVWIEKVVWIFGPPAALFALLRLSRGKNDDDFTDGSAPPPRDISHWRVR